MILQLYVTFTVYTMAGLVLWLSAYPATFPVAGNLYMNCLVILTSGATTIFVHLLIGS